MTFQKTLMASAALAFLTTTGCASLQDQQHDKHVEVMMIDDAEFIFTENADGMLATLDHDMTVEVIKDDEGNKKYIVNGKEMSEKVFKASDMNMFDAEDKGISILMKHHAEHKGDMKQHKKHFMIMKKHMKNMKHQQADIEQVRAIVKRMKIDMGGKGQDGKSHFIIMNDDMKISDMGEFPRTIDLDNDVQVFVEKDGHVRITKDGKNIYDAQENVSIDKEVTIENGKRKTRIVIDLIDEE